MTEKEKMLSGMVYSAVDRQLLEELNAVKEVIHRYNALSPADNAGRLEILKGLLGHIADEEIIINQPFYCDYGKQISVGKRFFANFHFMLASLFCQAYDPATANQDLGIPYMDRPETELNPQYERGTVADVYAAIEKDLQKGLPLVSMS